MYYGMDGFGMDDLALQEMGADAAASSGVVNANDLSQIGNSAQNLSTIYANYLLAKNKMPPLPCAPGTYRQNPNDPTSPCLPVPVGNMNFGMSETTKTTLLVVAGVAALGGLVWAMQRRRGRNPSVKSKDDGVNWRTIGE